MLKRARVVLYILLLVGLALIFGSQVWAQSPQGDFSEIVVDGYIKVSFTPTGEQTCFACTSDNPPEVGTCGDCGDGWVYGETVTLYIVPDPTDHPEDARLITSVGPNPGCFCYSTNPCCYRVVGGVPKRVCPCPP